MGRKRKGSLRRKNEAGALLRVEGEDSWGRHARHKAMAGGGAGCFKVEEGRG
jgi:hypothetical protein